MTQTQNATVIGLGIMGFALAELLLKNNYKTTVWNRTAGKANEITKKGAKGAASVIEAVQVSDVTIVCVSDYEAVNEVINKPEALEALSGKTLINLTTGNALDANQLNDLMERYDVKYLDGAILSFADQMGQENTTLVVSGDRQGYEKHKDLLGVFGGNIKYLGVKPSASSAFDQSILYYMYGALTGFFQGVLIAEKEGIDLAVLGDTIGKVAPDIGYFIKHEAEKIKAGNFDVTLSSMAINAHAVQKIYATAKDYGVDLKFPELLNGYYTEAEKMGLSNNELASLIKVFRGK